MKNLLKTDKKDTPTEERTSLDPYKLFFEEIDLELPAANKRNSKLSRKSKQ